VATLAIIAASAVMVWKVLSPSRPAGGDRTLSIPAAPVPLAGATLVGDESAKVVLIEFSEFQCPYCGTFARDTLPKLKAEYVDTGKVQLAFRQFPLSMHQNAERASEVALCAGRQGKFWQMHDSLFSKQTALDEASLMARADELGLSDTAFKGCLSGQMKAQIQDDMQAAKALGVSSTPAFFVGSTTGDGTVVVKKTILGARPIEDFKAAISSVLAGVGR
jgi:protein-disulfide isomerase